ncbi:MAG: hypothetical protein VW491_01285 [Gammaproteobacteria bacterium]|jgi:hypothetical protein
MLLFIAAVARCAYAIDENDVAPLHAVWVAASAPFGDMYWEGLSVSSVAASYLYPPLLPFVVAAATVCHAVIVRDFNYLHIGNCAVIVVALSTTAVKSWRRQQNQHP